MAQVQVPACYNGIAVEEDCHHMINSSTVRKQYRKPVNPFIGRGEDTEALYKREDKRDEAFKLAAESLGRVLGFTERQFWTHTLPEALFGMLDHWDSMASEQACIAFLERRGFTIQPPKEQPQETEVEG
jgi:hypothetical protein